MCEDINGGFLRKYPFEFEYLPKFGFIGSKFEVYLQMHDVNRFVMNCLKIGFSLWKNKKVYSSKFIKK